MELRQLNPYWNPYYVCIKDKYFCIDSIFVFDTNGIITHNHSGWFGSNNNVPVRTFECDCVRKNKIDFNCATAFIVKNNENTWSSEPRYQLYLPEYVVSLNDPEYYRANDYMLEVIRKSSKYDDVYFKEIYCLDKRLCVLQNEYEEICDKLKSYESRKSNELMLMQVDSLRAKICEYIAEKERLKNLTLNAMIKEAKELQKNG